MFLFLTDQAMDIVKAINIGDDFVTKPLIKCAPCQSPRLFVPSLMNLAQIKIWDALGRFNLVEVHGLMYEGEAIKLTKNDQILRVLFEHVGSIVAR